MKIANIDFPKPLLNALRNGELVVFAGAGVSMGEPACLPSFKALADMIAQGTGKSLQKEEPIDHFLGELQRAQVKIHARAARLLPQDREATELHRNLLRLYSNAEQVRVVTTNFDLLFEQAAEGVFNNSQPDVFRAPALPLGHRFNGIVHIHGAVSHSDDMVITDVDFGCAYLNEAWARRFLVDLFHSFTVLFVGYSHKDVILNYLARALPVGEVPPRFALTGGKNDDAEDWRVRGIEPICYPQSDKHDHGALYEGVCGLSDLVQRSVLEWHCKITAIVEKPPPFDRAKTDLIEYALGDATKTRFFTKAASDPDWIDWLDERGILNALFEDGTLSERDRALSWWLAENFACNQADKLFFLIGKHNMRLNPHFWDALGRTIGREETPLDKDILSRWISLLLDTTPMHESTNVLLYHIGKCCIKHEILDSLLQVFDTMASSRLLIKESIFWDRQDNESPPVDMELPLIGNYSQLERLWKGGLKPQLFQIAEPLLERVVKRLEERYLTLHAWQKANRNSESTSYSRSAIEPHEQDVIPKAVDVLIDVARNCLEWLVSNQVETAAWWCDRLVDSDAPLLRRLAVHGVFRREDMTADDKIDWLLTHMELHDRRVRHEIFVAVRRVYSKINSNHRESLISAVWDYRWPNDEDPQRAKHTARRHFDWFDWLHKSDPNCASAKQALDRVSAEYQEFKPRKYPDLTHWISSVKYESPWTVEELLAKSAADWLEDLLSFQGTEWGGGPNRRELMVNVAEAIKQDFDWGLELADALARSGEWNVDLWSVLIQSWSEMALDEDKHRRVHHWLDKTELYPEHHSPIADALYTLVKNGGTSYALNVLPQANKIASNLWHHLDHMDSKLATDTLIADTLAQFWLSGFSLWRKQQDPMPTALSDEYHQVLSGIVQDQKLPGRRGRTVLASHFAFLLAVDEVWTRENLLPLFDPKNGIADFQAVWDGFLSWGRLNPAVAEVMADLFLKAVERIDSDLADQRDQFIRYYTDMLTHFVEDPLDKWIPKLFQYGGQEARQNFALNLGYRLQDMSETAQQELWQHWLKHYWQNRLDSVPPPALESGEITNMLNWLPNLTAVFPEAVDLAAQMQEAQLENCWVIDRLNESDLSQRYPEEIAKLLIYLWECNLPKYTWVSGRELIDKLLQLDISSEQKQKLKEIKIECVSKARRMKGIRNRELESCAKHDRTPILANIPLAKPC